MISFSSLLCISPGSPKCIFPVNNPFLFTTRWAGKSSEWSCALFFAQPTMRADYFVPRHAAIAPYDVTRPRGICFTTSYTSVKNDSSFFPEGLILESLTLAGGLFFFFTFIHFSLKDQHWPFRLFYIDIVIWTVPATIATTVSSAEKILSCKHCQAFFVWIWFRLLVWKLPVQWSAL